jgi:hypothetical protein
MVPHLAIYTIEAKPKRPFWAHNRDSARWARRFDFLTTQTIRRVILRKWGLVLHINNGKPTDVTGRRERRVTTLGRGQGLFSIGEAAPMGHQHGSTLYRGHKSDKKFQSSAFLFSLRIPLSFLRVCVVAKSSMIQTCKPGYIAALEGYLD